MATKHDQSAAAALAAVMISNKVQLTAPLREQRSGRLDRKMLTRVPMGHRDVFKRPGAQAPKRMRVVLLLDNSGSMGDPVRDADGKYDQGPTRVTRRMRAGQLARDLIEATLLVHGTRAEAWDHTTKADNGMHACVVRKLWTTGQPTKLIDVYTQRSYSAGNQDGVALAYVVDSLRESRRSDEANLVLVLSDGLPSYNEGSDWAASHIRRVCEEARKDGIAVVSVAIAPELGDAEQRMLYGADNMVTYNPNANALANSLAKVVGKAMSAHDDRPR